MEETTIGLVMFLLVIYVFFTFYLTISGFESKKQSKITAAGFAVLAIVTLVIFWNVETAVQKASTYLLPVYFIYNFVQILGNTTSKRCLLHFINLITAGAIVYLLLY